MQHGELRADRGSRLPASSSSSSTSPTTTVLCDSETREREDLSGMDFHPVPVSSSHVGDRTERPVVLQHPGVAARIQRKSSG